MDEATMREFSRLDEIIEKLLCDEGCQWMKSLTLSNLRQYMIEEMYELIEAIDENDGHKMEEELGDVIFNIMMIARLGGENHNFSLRSALHAISNKLIRRNPHVFAESGPKKLTSQEVYDQWLAIKKQEKLNSPHRDKSEIDLIAKTLPTLIRARKVSEKLKKSGIESSKQTEGMQFSSSEELGNIFFTLIQSADLQDIDPEIALREAIQKREQKFKEWEKQRSS